MSRIVVVGDLLLDREVRGEATRLVPDSPVAVLASPRRTSRPGGAGLAALLASRAGHSVTLVCAVAADDAAAEATRMLEREGVAMVPLHANGRTPEKTRVGTSSQCLVRVDDGSDRLAPAVMAPGAKNAVAAALSDADAVVVADYGRGTVDDVHVRAALGSVGRPMVWDPHPSSKPPSRRSTVVCPNDVEAASCSPSPPPSRSGRVARASWLADELVGTWSVPAVAVTMGPGGAVLSTGHGAPVLAAPVAPSTGDSCGAGDCFAVMTAASLADGALVSEAVARGVDDAAAYVARGGPATLDVPRTADRAGWRAVVDAVRRSGGTVVATGGCFDLLHAGHVATIDAARRLGDCLVVLVNDDASVRRLKGDDRPFTTLADRVRVLDALGSVDAVLPFDEDDPVATIRMLRPDVWVKGGDYTGQELPEAEVLRSWGGEVVTVPYLSGRSTTGLARSLSGGARHD